MPKHTVAIIGLSGFLGKPTLEAFESDIFADKFTFPIKAITRSEKTSTEKVEYITDNLENTDSVAEKLKGTDVIISLLGANPSTFASLESVIKQVKPKIYIPSQFGTDIEAVESYASGFLTLKTQHSEAIRKAGIKVVDIITALFAVPGAFLFEIVGAVGIDVQARTVTYRGDPLSKFAISKLSDVGKSIASVASKDPSELPDKVRIFSEIITYKDVVENYEKSHNVKLTVSKTSAEEAKKEFQEKLSKGFNPSDFLFYVNAIIAQGVDGGLLFSEDERDLVNPKESLWRWESFI